VLVLASTALAQTPRSVIPPELARALVHGDTRMVIVGDSLSVNGMADPSGNSHCPLPVGIARQWQPDRWHGLFSQAARPGGGYENLRGVGASSYDNADTEDRVIGVLRTETWPGNLFGFGTEDAAAATYLSDSGQSWWNLRSSFRLLTSPYSSSPVSRQLMQSPTLRARNIIYRHPGMTPMTDLVTQLRSNETTYLLEYVSPPIDISAVGWTSVDIPVGALLPPSFNRSSDNLRLDVMARPAAGPDATYITMGTLWVDPATPGLQVHSIAQGGWSSADHALLSPSRGYSDLGLRENLRVFGFADPGVTRVVMIALGSNIAPGEADEGGATSVLATNITLVMNRYRNALQNLGVNDAWFILVGMHSLDFAPDLQAVSRAQKLYELSLSQPRCGFMSVPAMLGLRGEGFQSAWYFHQPQTVVTQSAAQTATTLHVASTAGFWSSNDSFYATDGVNRVRGVFNGLTGTSLLNVTMDGPLNAGARLMPWHIDIHLSRAGSDAIAQAMWSEIAGALVHCNQDYNGDGDHGTEQDIEAFFRCLTGTCCAGCTSDFNGDDDYGTDQDIEAFFRVLTGAPC